ncbi:hypothetical protein ABZ589_35430 [Streptomyces sp. NPDC013313]|uniref:hypothetical protein n=1 Tax=Streptomyces sp. NPDC013313 TaxID=3155603 RepID=UPI0033E9D5E7
MSDQETPPAQTAAQLVCRPSPRPTRHTSGSRSTPTTFKWRRDLVERQLRLERLDQWVGYGFRLLEHTI